MKAKDVLRDFRLARQYRKKWIDEAEEDFEYLLGDQWDDKDVDTLAKKGIKALTINKIQPLIFLTSGVQRQNRTDFMAFPEGEEDSIVANIITRLLKNTMKQTMGEFKLSEMFEDGITCGEGYLEPYIDYTYDLINGEMKLTKTSPFDIFPAPGFKEYDMSDARFIIKLTTDLLKEQLYQLFPDKKKVIDRIKDGKVNIDTSPDKETDGGYKKGESIAPGEEGTEEQTYDLVEEFYKKYITKYLVADEKVGKIKECVDREEA